MSDTNWTPSESRFLSELVDYRRLLWRSSDEMIENRFKVALEDNDLIKAAISACELLNRADRASKKGASQ